jgi:arylsulfatase
MADLLSDAGYATACYGKWHLGDVAGRFPTDQGFDEWWGISESSDTASYTAHPLYPKDAHVPMILESKKGEEPRPWAEFDLETRPLMDERITERTVEFIHRNAASGTPFYIYAPFTNLHPPMIPHPDFADVSPSPLPGNLAELDYRTGQILDALEEAGVADNTIVVWVSDNAAAQLQGSVAGSNGPWRGAFGGGWEGSIRTPGIVRWPGHIPAGITSDEIVAAYDWMPSLAALAGLGDKVPDDRPIDGLDMSSFMLGETTSSGRESFLFMGTDAQIVSAKWKTMKVHFRLADSDSWTASLLKPQIPSVYDLAADPAETINLMDTDLTVSWVIGQALAPLIDLQASAQEYPHIPVGADFDGYDT